MALIRNPQAIRRRSAGVRSAEKGVVRGYAVREKAQCEVCSTRESTVRAARSAAKGEVRGTQCEKRHSAEVRCLSDSENTDLRKSTHRRRTTSADLRSLDSEELWIFAGPSW